MPIKKEKKPRRPAKDAAYCVINQERKKTMTLIEVEKEIKSTGMPLYDLRKIFKMTGDYTDVDFSLITIQPGARVPAAGDGFHEADEYSYFLEGEVYTVSGEDVGVVGKGQATLIPRGERHWCENRTDKPCTLVCMMVKPR